jgi:hypothetical protein
VAVRQGHAARGLLLPDLTQKSAKPNPLIPHFRDYQNSLAFHNRRN